MPCSALSPVIYALSASTWEICTIGGVLLNEEAMWNKNNDRDQFMTVVPEIAELELVLHK